MFTLLLLTLTLTSTSATLPSTALQEPAYETAPTPPTETELRLALRDLWSGHASWVRSYVVASHYGDVAAAEASEAKVVENARSLADAIIPLYGKDASNRLFELLAGHYGAIKEYQAARSGTSDDARKAAIGKLTSNAGAIADFLDGANPNLPKSAVLPLLMAHGGHHLQQIDAFHSKDFKAEAEIWDAMVKHMNTIADAMAGAFVKQFPEKFSS